MTAVKLLQNRAAPSMVLPHHDVPASAKLVLLALPVNQPSRVRSLPARTGLSLRTCYRAVEVLSSLGLIVFSKGQIVPNLEELQDWHESFLMDKNLEKNPAWKALNEAVKPPVPN